MLYEVVIYLSNDAYLPALPQISLDLNTTHHWVQLSLTTWFMGASSMQLILAPITDRYGRRPVVLAGAVVFVITALICAFTQSITTMMIVRFIQGATIPALTVPGYAAIHEYFDHKKAIITLAWMNSVTVLAPALGPLFGSAILVLAGWRWIFGILAIGALLSLLGLFFNMPETHKEGHKHPIELKKSLKQYTRIITNKNYMSNAVSQALLFGAMIAWIVAGPFLVMDTFNLTSFTFGIFQAIIFSSFLIGTRTVKPLIEKYPAKTIAKTGITLALTGATCALLLAWLFPNLIYGTVFSMILIAIGAGISFPILSRLLVEASEEPMGARMAISSTLMTTAAVISSALISQVYNGSLLSLSFILIAFSLIAYLVKQPGSC